MFFEWIARFWTRRRAAARLNELHFVMYTRPGCHLCETAWTLLQAKQQLYRFTLTMVEVDTDPGLTARYGAKVPVVTINGRVRFWGEINEALLNRFLRE